MVQPLRNLEVFWALCNHFLQRHGLSNFFWRRRWLYKLKYSVLLKVHMTWENNTFHQWSGKDKSTVKWTLTMKLIFTWVSLRVPDLHTQHRPGDSPLALGFLCPGAPRGLEGLWRRALPERTQWVSYWFFKNFMVHNISYEFSYTKILFKMPIYKNTF